MSLAKLQDTKSINKNTLYSYILPINNGIQIFRKKKKVPITTAPKNKILSINLTKYI